MHISMLMDIPFGTGSWVGRYMPLACYLSRRGHKITILMPNHEPKRRGYPLEGTEKVTIYETGRPFFRKVDQGRKNYSTLRLSIIGLQNIIRSIYLLLRLNPDLMIVCKPLPIAGFLGLFFKLVKGKKIILDCDDAEVAINSVRSKFQRSIIHIFENVLPKLSDRVLCNTEYNLNRIREFRIPQEKISYIPNGVDVVRFSNINHNPSFKEKLSDDKVILYYGDLNFTSGHNIDILLHAFKVLLSKYPSAKLLIIGDGTNEGDLKSLALELGIGAKVLWKGRIKPEEVPNYVSASSIVVDPVRSCLSNWARCPVKIIEAMYMGKPVVTSDVGDRKKLLGDFGFFAQENDPDSMAKRMLEAIDNKEFQRNKDLVVQRALSYSWDKLADKVEDLLKKVLVRGDIYER